MNIGIVLYPTFGGSGVVATELGNELAKKGHQVHFITYREPVRLNTFEKNISFHEVSVSDYPLFEYQPYEMLLASKIVDVTKYEKLDLLHVHYAIPHASAAFLAQQILKSQGINLPFVTTLHGTDITLVGKDPSFEPVITFCINESDAVTSVSESLKQDTYAHFNVNKEIQVIPNFIHTTPQLPVLNSEVRRFYAEDEERILVHVSNFRKVKRIDDVVKIFHLVHQKIPCKLLFVGDGPERAMAEKMARDLGIICHIRFVGKVRNTQEVLQYGDLFLLPSETESFGLAALEAMAVGVPVISSNTGGIPEVNTDGYSGYLSNVGDVENMANNALKILQNKTVLSQFKLQALERSKDFTFDKIIPLYEKLYEEVIKQHTI
jgi:N-acetyl-alpha-D-glucosaminyl L-malate synthase BshA